MPLVLHGKSYNGITITGDKALETYAQNTPPPEDVQHGRVYFANGEKLVGTGKAFEFAEYGLRKVDLLTVSEGVERYGIEFEEGAGTNVILISPDKGDAFFQTSHLVTLSENEPFEIGKNLTAGGEIYALQSKGHLKVYFTKLQDGESRLRFFIGKDNEV